MRLDIADLVLEEVQAGRVDRDAAIRILQGLRAQQPVAIVGMGALTADTDSYREVWERFRRGDSFIRRAPNIRGDLVSPVLPGGTLGSYRNLSKGNYIEDIHTFDHEMFGFDEGEATTLSPHVRLALTTAYRALEDAGHFGKLADSQVTGVYVGRNFVYDQFISYGHVGLTGRQDTEAILKGIWTTGMATRISRAFNLRGPSQALDGACASSSIAIIQACNAIQEGRIDAAVAGGMILDLTPTDQLNEPGIFGRGLNRAVPKTFGRENDGGYDGEYVGMVVLKPLARALEHGDRIHAVIRGWSESNAGDRGRFDQTSPQAAADIVDEALRGSATPAEDIGLVFCEGFAEKIEEALEIDGIAKGFEKGTSRRQFAALTTATPQLGYMQSAIGVAQLQLLAQALSDRVIPKVPHFDYPTDLYDLTNSPFYIPTEMEEWEQEPGKDHRGLIYSNAYGGFYLGTVVGQAPEREPLPPLPHGTELVFTVSAHNEQFLHDKALADAELLDAASPEDAAAMAFTSACRQSVQSPHRIAVIARTGAELAAGLRASVASPSEPRMEGAGWVTIHSQSDADGSRPRRARAADVETLDDAATTFVRGAAADFEAFFPKTHRRMAPLNPQPLARHVHWAMPIIPLTWKEQV